MPAIGTPTFRIDYFAVTVTRFDNISDALSYSRPVVGLFLYLQAVLAKLFLQEQAKYITYALQHLALLLYFFSVAKIVQSIFKTKLNIVQLLIAWLLFIVTPAVMEGVYKLETIVGTLSMIFGAFALIFLARWDRDRRNSSAIIFCTFYAFSVFAKEDFLLPPLFILGWYVVRDGDWKARVMAYKWIFFAVFSILLFFLIFNKLMIPGRSFISPVKLPSSPYFMTLAPQSIIKVVSHYSVGIGSNIKYIFILYVATSSIALLFQKKWKETLLIALIVAGLVAPYAIMPNHIFSYYSQKWLVWQALTAVALIQILFTRKYFATATSCMVATAILAPTLVGIYQRDDKLWFQAAYFRGNFATSHNIRNTLVRNREAINAHKQIAVVGIGPGQISQSPWQGNGETAFYLSGDLKLSPQWVLFVKSEGPGYESDKDAPDGHYVTSKIIVRNIAEIDDYKTIPRLVFEKDGNGRFIDASEVRSAPLTGTTPALQPYKQWSAFPGLQLSATPSSITSCPSDGTLPAVQVTWDVLSAASGNPINIWVSRGNSRKLWLSGNSVGTALSGPWVDGGVKFGIEDATTHEQLASATIGGISCL